jgi:hypothetical protein
MFGAAGAPAGGTGTDPLADGSGVRARGKTDRAAGGRVSEDLPTGPPSTADASGVLAAKICGWCWQPIPAGKRRDAKTCSARCRRAATRFRVEPLLVWGGRRSSLAPGEVLDDTLVHAMNGGRRSHPGALPGMKPPQFSRWLFRLLGLARGDTFVDLFPGSGAVTRAWQLYTRELPDPATERGELGDPNTGTSPDVLLRPATPRPARRSRS